MSDEISDMLHRRNWFNNAGVVAIVDGQFGSTGKGVAASILERANKYVGVGHLLAETNAGPNSGHTAVFNGHKMVTQQIPISAVQRRWAGGKSTAFLNAGAVIDLKILAEEIATHRMEHRVLVHPNAAVIDVSDITAEIMGGPSVIASTAKGVGSAISKKAMRESELAKDYRDKFLRMGAELWDRRGLNARDIPAILEVAQGFSLGINQQFYPHCTSRECTVGQALSDAGLHPYYLRKTLMCVRTFPIRVGNTEKGNSGGCYSDQRETSWEEIEQEPELTTVTKRVRRVFTWSNTQFRHALEANRPDAIFLNFCNYLKNPEYFIKGVYFQYVSVLGKNPDAIITGWGPETESAILWPI